MQEQNDVHSSNADTLASKFLGKRVGVCNSYDASLLVAVPRNENRIRYEIDANTFNGFDVWHAYEFSTMTKNGVPLTKLLKIKYSAQSEFIIESKSLKLYLNSFNMMRFKNSVFETLNHCKKIIENDLSNILKTDVEVCFINDDDEKIKIFSKFNNIMNCVDETKISVNDFSENPKLLAYQNDLRKSYYLKFDSLRSNCRVTHQPDFASLFIYYNSEKHILEDSLVKYLVSFRGENHFHEECCEMIFKRLSDILDFEDELFVCALYSRRGGIDICPVRWKNCSIDDANELLDVTKFAKCGICYE